MAASRGRLVGEQVIVVLPLLALTMVALVLRHRRFRRQQNQQRMNRDLKIWVRSLEDPR